MRDAKDKIFHTKVDDLLSDAPTSPVLIERSNDEQAVLMTYDFYQVIKDKAEAYDDAVRAGKITPED